MQDGSTNENFGAITTSGTYTFYGKANNASLVIGRRTGGTAFDSYIDNVSVKEVGQNWTFTSGATIDDGEVVLSPSANISQNCGLVSGKKYRIKYDITSIDAGGSGVTVYAGSTGAGTTRTQVGTYTEDIVSSGIQTLYFFTGGSFVSGSIDNISVKQITDDTNLPRINYEGGKGHLLLEGQSTNLLTYSEDYSQWTKNQTTIILNSAISPDGLLNGAIISEDNSNNYHRIRYGFTSSVDTTISIFAKKGTIDKFLLFNGVVGIGFDLTLGTINEVTGVSTPSESNIKDFGNGWYRCSITHSSANSHEVFTLQNFSGYVHQGLTTNNFYIWGAMLEQGKISSYIPTNGSAVTRAAETCNNAGNADLFDSEGVLYADIAALANDGGNRIIALSDGTSSNRIILLYDSVNNNLRSQGLNGGVTIFDKAFVVTSVLDFNKLAIRYKDDDFSLWVNGTQVGIDTSGTAPTGLRVINFDRGDGSGNAALYGKTKMVAVFPYLSNDEMECLTGEGYGSFEAMALANNYTII